MRSMITRDGNALTIAFCPGSVFFAALLAVRSLE